MNIIINSKPAETGAANLNELAEELKLPQRGVAVAVDGNMVQRAQWAQTPLTEGANVLIVKAACGG